jgi:predicted XRE-type DNA-binding protein
MAQRYANLYAQDVKEKIEQHSALSQQRISSGKTIRKSRKNKLARREGERKKRKKRKRVQTNAKQ